MPKSSQNIWGSMIFISAPPEISKDVWNILIFPESSQGETSQQTERVFTRLKPRFRKLAEQSGVSFEEYIRAILELDSVVTKRRSCNKKKKIEPSQ